MAKVIAAPAAAAATTITVRSGCAVIHSQLETIGFNGARIMDVPFVFDEADLS